jgi:hypothetical protein
MHFGENQLSPRSFGISPLPTAPLTVLQHGTVRASTPVSGRFTLAMGSSRGFGSLPSECDWEITLRIASPCSDSLSLWHQSKGPSPPRGKNSPAHSSIGTPSPLRALTACPHTVAGSLSLPSRGSFHRSLTVLSAIGRRGSLALERGRPSFPPDFSCRVVLTVPCLA